MKLLKHNGMINIYTSISFKVLKMNSYKYRCWKMFKTSIYIVNNNLLIQQMNILNKLKSKDIIIVG